ncbi:hypothetical protein ACJ5H2_10150 [Nocardioides sp. R1-1]|uniref:hypothetical protein n=1 Tax=Nocardioides sp. R1-1 TaxID=3383502 RepID=UPI0038D00126
MIRERREQDLDRLAAVLLEVPGATAMLAGRAPRAWLTEDDDAAEASWVFDQAPVPVAPTKNVVGHVQVRRPPADAPWLNEVAIRAGVDAGRLLVIGRLFVRPMKHDRNIARYLLKQAASLVAARGSAAVFESHGLGVVPPELPRRLGLYAAAGPPGSGR